VIEEELEEVEIGKHDLVSELSLLSDEAPEVMMQAHLHSSMRERDNNRMK
jgi:hypothetical protein